MDLHHIMLALYCFVANMHGTGAFTPRFSFTDPVDLNDAPEGLCHDDGNWTLRGTIEMSTQDLIIFRNKVHIQTCSPLCTVDLSQCGQQETSSVESCHCSHRTGDVYGINIASTAKLEHSGKQLQAVIPSHNDFGHITSSAIIGQLPTILERTTRVGAQYRVDGAVAKKLLPVQTIGVCENTPVELEVCVDDPGLGSVLKLSIDGQDVISSRACVDLMRRYDVPSTSSHRLTFSYRKSNSCTHEELFVLFVQEDKANCIKSTTPTAEQTTTTVVETTPTTPTPTTPALVTVAGVCPDTPRSLVTLPLVFSEVLVDDVSLNTSWTVIQRRVSGKVNFYRGWTDYVQGFGQVNDSFWVGLDQIHRMCNQMNKCELLIHVQYPEAPREVPKRADGCYHALYSDFWLSGPDDNFRLTVGQYSGSAGDSFRYGLPVLDGQQFSTFDRDNDQATWNCAKGDYGSWWYGRCSRSTLNGGHWGRKGSWASVTWSTLTWMNSVTFCEMKVRRRV